MAPNRNVMGNYGRTRNLSALLSTATLQALMNVVPSHRDMCVCVEYVVDSPKRQKDAMNTGRQPPAIFNKCHGLFFNRCHGLFYVPTGTRDGRLNVPSEGHLVVHWCSVRRQRDYHAGS